MSEDMNAKIVGISIACIFCAILLPPLLDFFKTLDGNPSGLGIFIVLFAPLLIISIGLVFIKSARKIKTAEIFN